MTRTRATPIIGLAIVGLAIGYLIEYASAAGGRPLVIPPVTFSATLIAVAAIVVGFAIPIRRAVTGKAQRMIDPFRAMRVVVLAKACSLVGGLLIGVTVGALGFLLTRPVMPAVGSTWLTIAALAASAILLVAALVAEHLCTLPKDDDDDDTAGAAPSR